MSAYKFGGVVVTKPTPKAAFKARALKAATRRATTARARADRNPTPENLNRAAELEAGLARLEQA